MERYKDRNTAGKILAKHLKEYANKKDAIILALPRGGVPVAYEIANKLHLPLDVFVVRKLGVPGSKELAFGAIASGDVIVFNDEVVRGLQISKDAINKVIQEEQIELKNREEKYSVKTKSLNLTGKNIILIDDGIATGATMQAAIKALKKFQPNKIIVAVPVAEFNTCILFSKIVDEFICPLCPKHFFAVGNWYDNFEQTSDAEVKELLNISK